MTISEIPIISVKQIIGICICFVCFAREQIKAALTKHLNSACSCSAIKQWTNKSRINETPWFCFYFFSKETIWNDNLKILGFLNFNNFSDSKNLKQANHMHMHMLCLLVSFEISEIVEIEKRWLFFLFWTFLYLGRYLRPR